MTGDHYRLGTVKVTTCIIRVSWDSILEREGVFRLSGLHWRDVRQDSEKRSIRIHLFRVGDLTSRLYRLLEQRRKYDT